MKITFLLSITQIKVDNKEGLKENKCEGINNIKCGISEWAGMELKCELDHINSDSTDHRLRNLRILCPNCHAQTETY